MVRWKACTHIEHTTITQLENNKNTHQNTRKSEHAKRKCMHLSADDTEHSLPNCCMIESAHLI